MKAEEQSALDEKQAFLINFALKLSGWEEIWKEGMGSIKRELCSIDPGMFLLNVIIVFIHRAIK